MKQTSAHTAFALWYSHIPLNSLYNQPIWSQDAVKYFWLNFEKHLIRAKRMRSTKQKHNGTYLPLPWAVFGKLSKTNSKICLIKLLFYPFWTFETRRKFRTNKSKKFCARVYNGTYIKQHHPTSILTCARSHQFKWKHSCFKNMKII